jgi:tetratricopeptide (TPR) repeat protein
MPTLRRWFEAEYERLAADGKSALVDAFKAANSAYFQNDSATALQTLPDIRKLAATLGEPMWQVVADYYTASANATWCGDLAAAREHAIRAVVRAAGQGNAVPALYAREVLFYAWLDTDGPGYASKVIAAIDEIDQPGLTPDVRARFRLVRAHALAAQGDGRQAASLALEALTTLNWPPAYRSSIRAGALAWQRRWDEAADSYKKAMEAFETAGQPIERTGAQIALADTLLEMGDADRALAEAEGALLAAGRSINQAHVAFAESLIGRTLLATGDWEAGAAWLGVALNSLEGLGWMRSEAMLALARLRAVHSLGVEAMSRLGISLEKARFDAEWHTDRLRSEDLAAELASLSRAV